MAEDQKGFRKNGSTAGAFSLVRQTVKECNKQAYMSFIELVNDINKDSTAKILFKDVVPNVIIF